MGSAPSYLAVQKLLSPSLSHLTISEHVTDLHNRHPPLPCPRSLAQLPSPITYRGADKSLARPTSRCILFDGENISFEASLVIYINSTNIPPIMIINKIHETQNLLSL